MTYASELGGGDYAVSVSCEGEELFSYNNESYIHIDLTSPPSLPEHTHSWSKDWNSSAIHHWHECEADGCTVTEDSEKDGYSVHTYDNDSDTTCNDCGYASTVSPTPGHTHNWSSAWSHDDTHHWRECSVTGCPVTANSEKDGYAAHPLV